jgi:hypothetical protein
MNVLLQKKSTLEYLKNQTEWTALRGEARVFASGLDALYFCYNHGIRNMQIVGECDGGLSFNVPVTDRRGS